MNVKKLGIFTIIAIMLMLLSVSIGAACTEKTHTVAFPPVKVPGYYTISGERVVDSHGKIIKDLVKVEFVSKEKSKSFLGMKGQDGADNRWMLAYYIIDYAISNGEYLTLQYQDQTRVAELLKDNIGQKTITFSGRVQ